MKKESMVILILFLTLALANTTLGSLTKSALILRWVWIATMGLFYILHKQFRRIDHIDVFFGLFIIESFFSRNYSISPNMTFEKSLLLLVAYLVIFFEIRRFVSFKKGLVAMYGILIRYSKYIVLITIFSVPIKGMHYGIGNRFYGIFTNPNALGIFCIVAVPTLFAAFIASKKRRMKKINLLFLAVALVVLFLSGSRSSLLATLLALGVYILAVIKNKVPYMLGAMFLFIALLAAFELMGTESITEKFENKFRIKGIARLGGRAEAWEAAKVCIRKRPFWGHGYGAEGNMFKYYNIVFKEHYGSEIHNSYLSIIATNGYLGLLLMLPVLGSIILSCIRLFVSRNKLGQEKPIAMLFVGLVLGLLVNAIAESWMFAIGSMMSMIFWSLAAAVLVLDNFLRKGSALYE